MLTNKNKQQVEDWFKTLRDQICKSFEEIEVQFQHKLIKERPGKFSKKKWKRLKKNKQKENKERLIFFAIAVSVLVISGIIISF